MLITYTYVANVLLQLHINTTLLFHIGNLKISCTLSAIFNEKTALKSCYETFDVNIEEFDNQIEFENNILMQTHVFPPVSSLSTKTLYTITGVRYKRETLDRMLGWQ